MQIKKTLTPEFYVLNACSCLGSRYYNPRESVWLSVDPMFLKYPAMSPYAYCANNPVRYIDPLGLTHYKVDGEDQTIDDGHDDLFMKVSQRQFNRLQRRFERGGSGYERYMNRVSVANGYNTSRSFQTVDDGFTLTGTEVTFHRSGGASYADWSKNNTSDKGTPGINTAIGFGGLLADINSHGLEYIVRNNYKTANTWSEFSKLRATQQTWRTVNTLGKEGASFLKLTKVLGGAAAFTSVGYTGYNTYDYYKNGGEDWRVYTKAGIDVIMVGVGFLGPIGFGISTGYFLLDATTGGFGGWGAIPE